MLRQLDDGIEIAADSGEASVRLLAAERPWNDEDMLTLAALVPS